METRLLTIILDIETEADPIAGRLRVQGDEERGFTGWIELARVLEEALAASRERSPAA